MHSLIGSSYINIGIYVLHKFFICIKNKLMFKNGVREVDNENLHPTIIEFKRFVNQHPKLLEEIRKSGRSWQEYYEKWVLLGEEDQMWDQFTTSNKQSSRNTDMIKQIVKLTENIDLNKVQQHVSELSGTVSTLQSLLNQNSSSQKEESQQGKFLFSMFKD